MVFLRGSLVQIGMQRPQGQLDQDVQDQTGEIRTEMRVRARRFLRWATPVSSREQIVVYFAGRRVQIEMQRPEQLDKTLKFKEGKLDR